MTIVNSILFENDAPLSPELRILSGGQADVTRSLVSGGWPGDGNIDEDARFVNIENQDFRLRVDSPCVDRGDSSGVPLPDHDKDGGDRILDGNADGNRIVDLGAHELALHNAARYGTVNAGVGSLTDVVFLNGSAGDTKRVYRAGLRDQLTLSVEAPPAGPAVAPFVLYVWIGEPDDDRVIMPQPRNLGLMCFGSPMTGGIQPERIWNNLGHRRVLGSPDRNSEPAPSGVFDVVQGARYPLTATIQGFIADRGSAADGPLSITNAIVLHVEE